jgi:hypothetical protein
LKDDAETLLVPRLAGAGAEGSQQDGAELQRAPYQLEAA